MWGGGEYYIRLLVFYEYFRNFLDKFFCFLIELFEELFRRKF